MSMAQKWGVCESSGRWAAALRTAFARSSMIEPRPRFHEVRSLGDLSILLCEQRIDLILIEVEKRNFAEVLQWTGRCQTPAVHFVALLDGGAKSPPPLGTYAAEPIEDLLWEIGAVEVVESPRQLAGLLALYERLSAARHAIISDPAQQTSFADWAWATLPWQDS